MAGRARVTQPLLSVTAPCSGLSSLTPPLPVHLVVHDHQASADPRTCQALSNLSAFATAVPPAENAPVLSLPPRACLLAQPSETSCDVTSPAELSQTPSGTVGQRSPYPSELHLLSVSFPTHWAGSP